MRKNIVISHLIITALVGFLFFVVGQILYRPLTEKLWTPLGIAIYFLIFSVVMLIALFVLNQVRQDYSYWVQNGKKDTVKKSFHRGIACVLVVFLLSGVFEFIYEIGKTSAYEPTSYIFLIDDSGSMAGSDPQFMRRDAISRIMDNQSVLYHMRFINLQLMLS